MMAKEGPSLNWIGVLKTLASRINASTAQIDWFVMGSAATAIHGCDITPGDLDVAVHRPQDVFNIATLFSDALPSSSAYTPDDTARWISTQAAPVTQFRDPLGFQWHFARWFIDAVKVEVACIQAPDNPVSGQVLECECRQPKYVPVEGTAVPVVPLELQLRTNLDRGKQERVEEILQVLQTTGYDALLLMDYLTNEQLSYIKQRLLYK